MSATNRMLAATSARALLIVRNALTSDPEGPQQPSPAAARRLDAGRIVASQCLQPATLQPAQRSVLVDRLYDIYRETVGGFTRGEFQGLIFGADETRLALFYGTGGELVGFSFAGIDRMEHAGRTHAVFSAGAYFRLGYRGGILAELFGLRQALRFKFREPRTPLALMTRASSPAVYRLLATTMPRIYPSRRRRTPADIEALVTALSAQWHRWYYIPVGESPWVVRSRATPHDGSRMHRLEQDPDVRFYTELNPRFAAGEALVVWTPLDAANIAGGFWRLLRARFGSWSRSRN